MGMSPPLSNIGRRSVPSACLYIPAIALSCISTGAIALKAIRDEKRIPALWRFASRARSGADLQRLADAGSQARGLFLSAGSRLHHDRFALGAVRLQGGDPA